MNLRWDSLPIAGEIFSFTVEHETSVAKTFIYIDDNLVFTEECSDPPCHEMYLIPHNAADKVLLLKAQDSNGNIFIENFVITNPFNRPLTF